MKKRLLFALCAVLIIMAGCKKEEELSVNITQGPTGGYYTTYVSATIEGKILVKRPKQTFIF